MSCVPCLDHDGEGIKPVQTNKQKRFFHGGQLNLAQSKELSVVYFHGERGSGGQEEAGDEEGVDRPGVSVGRDQRRRRPTATSGSSAGPRDLRGTAMLSQSEAGGRTRGIDDRVVCARLEESRTKGYPIPANMEGASSVSLRGLASWTKYRVEMGEVSRLQFLDHPNT